MGMLDDAEKRLNEAEAAKTAAEQARTERERLARDGAALVWDEFLERVRERGLEPDTTIERTLGVRTFRWTYGIPGRRQAGPRRYLVSEAVLDSEFVGMAFTVLERRGYHPIVISEDGRLVRREITVDTVRPGLAGGSNAVPEGATTEENVLDEPDFMPLTDPTWLNVIDHRDDNLLPWIEMPLADVLARYLRDHT